MTGYAGRGSPSPPPYRSARWDLSGGRPQGRSLPGRAGCHARGPRRRPSPGRRWRCWKPTWRPPSRRPSQPLAASCGDGTVYLSGGTSWRRLPAWDQATSLPAGRGRRAPRRGSRKRFSLVSLFRLSPTPVAVLAASWRYRPWRPSPRQLWRPQRQPYSSVAQLYQGLRLVREQLGCLLQGRLRTPTRASRLGTT